MRSIVNMKPPTAKIVFPCLMQSSNKEIIVLMYKPGKGIVVSLYEGNIHSLGRYSECWVMTEFEPFNGEVILSND